MKIHCVQWPRVYIDCTALRVCAQKVAPDARRLHCSPCVCAKGRPRRPLWRHARHGQKEGGITTSKLVPDARTTMNLRDLTSEVE